MRDHLELPMLSLKERDRRWAAIRTLMQEKSLDCLLLFGTPLSWDFKVANARFVSQIGGNGAHVLVVFPIEGEPTCIVSMPTFVPYWRRAQEWVTDIRPKRGPWADSAVARLKELGMEGKTIGVDALAGPLDPDGWIPHDVLARMAELMPGAKFTHTGDLLERVRAVKSAEEIGYLEKAARLGDVMLDVCRESAKPGIRECEVYAQMIEAMVSRGGELPTLFLWASDPHPLPHPFNLPTTRPLAEGDMIICEIHPKYGGYTTHVERTFCIGEPAKEYRHIYDGCIEAFGRGMELFTPGQNIEDALARVRAVIRHRGLDLCETGVHGHGLSSLEYPRLRLHAPPHADDRALEAIENEFRAGMVFAFNIDLFDSNWRDGSTGCVFGETVLITDEKARRLHTFPTDLQVLSA